MMISLLWLLKEKHDGIHSNFLIFFFFPILDEDLCVKNGNPCGDHGTCIELNSVQNYVCECDPGFVGDDCTGGKKSCVHNRQKFFST